MRRGRARVAAAPSSTVALKFVSPLPPVLFLVGCLTVPTVAAARVVSLAVSGARVGQPASSEPSPQSDSPSQNHVNRMHRLPSAQLLRLLLQLASVTAAVALGVVVAHAWVAFVAFEAFQDRALLDTTPRGLFLVSWNDRWVG